MEKTYEMYKKICERAESQGYIGDRLSLMMDIESADKVFNLRLEDWLNADDFNFMHDINAIVRNIIRDTFPATNFGYFVPRFAEIN